MIRYMFNIEIKEDIVSNLSQILANNSGNIASIFNASFVENMMEVYSKKEKTSSGKRMKDNCFKEILDEVLMKGVV